MNPVARRYALALYQEADAQGQTDTVDADVETLHEALAGSRELTSMFTSPVIPRQKKEAVLTALFGERLAPLTTRFMGLLVEKEREELLPDVVAAYRALRDERLGIVEATVRTALPLGADEADRLKAALEAREGKRIRMRIQVDPSLLGGLVVRVGDVVYDRSAAHQLQTLRAQLAERAAASLN